MAIADIDYTKMLNDSISCIENRIDGEETL
jgi:hypothetical protein